METPSRPARVLVSWSSGKDSAWALHLLRQQPDLEVVGLLTTLNEKAARVTLHGVRHSLVEAQAAAVGLPLWTVPLPDPCPNAEYEARMHAVIARAREQGVTHVAFGDLYLEDVRAYRSRMMAGTGAEPLFPLWCSPRETLGLARTMLRAGLRAVVTCVDPKQSQSAPSAVSMTSGSCKRCRPRWTRAENAANFTPSAVKGRCSPEKFRSAPAKPCAGTGFVSPT